jgi:hypothetical protein
MQRKHNLGSYVALAIALLTAGTAHAQFEAIARGLYLAGFRPDYQKNPLTDGFDFSGTASYFTGQNTLHYGVGTLTLNGNLTYEGYYAKKPIPSLSFGFSSAPGRGQTPQPIRYTLSIPRPTESVTVTGTATIDTSFKVDPTGFYHKVIKIDNRGTVKTDGVIDTEKNIDFTIGPIDQTGNIYLEGLSNLLSGKGNLTDLLNTSSVTTLSEEDLKSLDLNDPEQLEQYVNAALLDGITQAALSPCMGESCKADPLMVPEPSTLALLVLSGSVCVMGFRGRHRHAVG